MCCNATVEVSGTLEVRFGPVGEGEDNPDVVVPGEAQYRVQLGEITR
jgi:hypothetical protein